MTTTPELGKPAPEVSFRTPDRETVNSADLRGAQNLVIAFYAAAFTGG
jgi:peroxiredoxin